MATADTIAALLAKAEGTDNEHERDAFTKKAVALMMKLGISEAEVRARGAKKGEKPTEAIITATVYMKSRYGRALMSVGFYAVGALSGLRSYKTQRYNSEEGTLYIVGFESDVRRAVLLVESLKLQAIAASIRWAKSPEGKLEIQREMYASNKSESRCTWKCRRTFITYFGSGAGQRIKEVWGQAVKEASAGAELAIRDRQAQVNSWVDDNLTLRAGRSFGHAQGGAAHGLAAGRKADVGGRNVSDANRGQLN